MDGVSHSEPELLVTVDWERQAEETILVTYRVGDHGDSFAFFVGRAQDDNMDDERRALEQTVVAARELIGETRPPTTYRGNVIAEGAPLYRLIISEGPPANVRALFGSPQNPINIQADGDDQDEHSAAVIAAAHALVEAKLDPHEDTAA